MSKDQSSGTSEQKSASNKHQLAQIEEQMVAAWQKEKTFEQSLEQTKDGEHYEFYDGPPFANGLPHYGHVVSSIVKDAIPRYKTMRGYHVPRRFGWDCHGLPAEMKAEQDLDLGSKADIEDYGIEKFVNYCRTSVTEFTKEWEQYVTRIGRWVDFEENYYTMDDSYIESVMWAFKQLHDKGLVGEGFKVMPYCHVCETSLSHFETRQDDSFRERTDLAVTLRFSLESGESLLAWTTTPWTLPANLAVAVHRDLEYAVYEGNGERLILSPAAAEARYKEELEGYEQVATITGADLVGKSYSPPFNYYNGHANAHVVLHADFVTDEDGTGIAHEAPGFGEDDQVLCEANGIEVVVPVDAQGNYTEEVKAFAGMNVFEANPLVADQLKNQGALFKAEDYIHSYPHCWRTDNPLIYRAVSSWTVDVPRFKQELLDNNQKINWVPSNVKDGAFGKWLEGTRLWNVSRDRFWGAPIPVWKTDDGEVLVIGSLQELKKRAVNPEKAIDLHKPHIDDVILKTDSGKEAKRVPEVFDCWFESGSMPYAQHNYPFSTPDFKHPGDFIVEYIGQTRGWFYTLHVLSTALFGEPAFKNAISHGVILGSDGRKMSKKLGNYPDISHVFDAYGADSLRFYLFESPIMTGETVVINEKSIIDAQRNVFMTLLNSYRFFKTYSEIDNWQPPTELVQPKSDQPLDVWMLSRLNETIAEVTEYADAYDIPRAVRPLRKLIDDISNWYIRRSRRRFWKSENDTDKEAAYEVLWYVLLRTSQLVAPWAPFITDHMYRGLAGKEMPQSIHLTSWPEAGAVDQTALATMAEVREAISEGLAQRADAGIKIRQPLSSMNVVLKSTIDGETEQLIREEVNVKSTTVKTGSNLVVELDTKITTELKHEGLAREVVRHIQNFRKKSGLNVEDRITLALSTPDSELQAAIKTHQELIYKETLGSQGDGELEHMTEVKVSGAMLTVSLQKQRD